MKRDFLRAALAAVALAVAFIGLSCSTAKKAPTLFLPAAGTEIGIQLRFPFHAVSGTEQAFTYVCADALSLLVSVDVDSAANPGWDYRFLFGLDGSLWGCAADPGQPCAEQQVRSGLRKPYRIAVEGLDVSPADYSGAVTHNVICRGVADSVVGMGSITATVIPTPSPQPSVPPPQTTLTITASVPMLRVGDVNGTFTTAGALEGNAAAGLLGPSTGIPRKKDGGIGAFLDRSGTLGARFLEFDPRLIGATTTTTVPVSSRANPRTSGFLDSSGRASMLIVGGFPAGSTVPVESIEIYRTGSPGVEIAAPLSSTIGKSSLVELPDHLEGGFGTPAIAILGGGYMSGSTYFFSDRCFYFFPTAPVDLAGCATSSVTGRASLCTRGSGAAMGDGGHMSPLAGLVATPLGKKIFVGMGYIRFMTTNSKNTTNSYYFDPETHVSTGPISNFGSVQTLGNQVVTLTSSLVAFFGGFDDVAYSKHWAYFRGSDLSLVGASTQLLEPRYTPTQYRLPDGRVFLVGGVGPADPMTIEEFVPSGVADTSGTFVHLRRSILGPDCVASTDPNCVRLSPSRSSSQFSSFQILGSSTWINGAVVVVGPVPPGHGSEIFIPAYDCAGSRPVKAGYGTEIGDVDFCDRNRGRQALTDPASP